MRLAGRQWSLALRFYWSLGLLAAVASTACGGGGGGGGVPTGPPPPTSTIVFTPTGGGSGILLASGGGSQGATLTLEVRTTGIRDLYGVAFHLTYPAAVLHFAGATEGGVLNGGGRPTSFQVVAAPEGNLVVGLSRLGLVPGTAAAGTLMTLQFTGVGNGTGALAFTNVLATDGSGMPVPGVTWSAGTVQSTIVSGRR